MLIAGGQYIGHRINIIGVATSTYRHNDLLIINICDGTCGEFNYCYIQARGSVWSQNNEVLKKVQHGDFINLCGVIVGPGMRDSRYTLNIDANTIATLYR